ncbi:MAG: hypothetical protein IJU44_01450 [Kiritimatiellae bacterium]|nr:hypothetical protein [Kiritimatiellia bacterium]
MHFKKEYQKGVCSKTYINIIKQRLRSSGHTNLILDMVRNECHIRMLCSLWYVLTFIFRVLLLSFFVAAVIAAFNICGNANCDCRQGQPVIHSVMDNRESPVRENSGEVLVSAKCQIKILENRGRCPANPESSGTVLAFSVLIAASLLVFYCRYSIEYGLHYVRTREVVMILENAWIMDNVDYGPHPGIELRSHELMFQDIKDKAFDFKSRHCQCGVCKFWKECYGGV